MEFSKELREDVLSGEITVSFRLWRRLKVSPGRRYPVGPGWIEVDSIELVPFSVIDDDDVRRAGETDREAPPPATRPRRAHRHRHTGVPARVPRRPIAGRTAPGQRARCLAAEQVGDPLGGFFTTHAPSRGEPGDVCSQVLTRGGARGYRWERRGRNLIQAKMATASSNSQGENRKCTVKLRTVRATMAIRTRAMIAGMAIGLRSRQAVCDEG